MYRYRKRRIGCSLRYYRSSAPQSSRLLPNSPLRCQLRLAFCHHAMPCETHPYPIVTSYLFKAVRGVLVLLLLPHGENKRLSDPRLLLGETERVRGDTNVPGD